MQGGSYILLRVCDGLFYSRDDRFQHASLVAYRGERPERGIEHAVVDGLLGGRVDESMATGKRQTRKLDQLEVLSNKSIDGQHGWGGSRGASRETTERDHVQQPKAASAVKRAHYNSNPRN